jgi:hypothetical protein
MGPIHIIVHEGHVVSRLSLIKNLFLPLAAYFWDINAFIIIFEVILASA